MEWRAPRFNSLSTSNLGTPRLLKYIVLARLTHAGPVFVEGTALYHAIGLQIHFREGEYRDVVRDGVDKGGEAIKPGVG